MDLPSKNMYDTFKHEIWRELGPLDPDWFEALTAQTVTSEGSVSDQDDLCANQEGNFKTPFDKTTVDSQLFSTPKVFRYRRVVSPETEDEHSFTAEHEKETLPWTVTQSPCLFPGIPGAKYGGIQPHSQDSFDLLHTPQKSPVSHAKHISESLGAQIHPDMSWTSSLNTPSAVPSTLILSKTDESPCPVSVSADKDFVFVRKLFPSLSNASIVVSPKNNDMPAVHQGVVSPEAGKNPEPPRDSPQSLLNQSDSVWRQKLPDAIEDGEIRSTIAGVLDGAENVLSVFFTGSSSALRKVKTDRIKRKQIIPTIEHGSTEISTANNDTSSELRTGEQENYRFPSSPPVKTGENGITQWSPLSLSDIPPSTVDTSCHDNSPTRQVDNNILPEQLRNDASFGQQTRSPVKISDSGFTKKKRKFVYTVDSLKLQVQGKETQSQKMDSPRTPDSGQEVNMKQLGKVPDEADRCSIRKNAMDKQENLPPSVQAKVHDLDMSQLCRDFAQDFSQMSDPGKLSKVAEDTPRNGFCPSACLSAMKREKQKARQANLHNDCDGVSNRRHVSATNQNTSINEGTTSDSGFHSANITHMTASSFVLPSSENNRPSQQWTGFKTDIHKTTTFQSTNKGNGKPHLDDILQEAETDAKLSTAIKSQTMGPGKENELHIECTSAQLSRSAKETVNNINYIPLNGQVDGSLLEKTVSLSSVHASGFKTASNKGIPISSANLERAKHLLEDTEGERTLSDQPIKCAHDSKAKISSQGSVKNTTYNSNQPPTSSEKCVDISCHLTASQKADVTELCTLMEEADSQFEFTQFKTAKQKKHCEDNATSPKKVDKELDPDFLTGIDFDDSFSSDAEKHKTVTDKMTLDSDAKTNCETANVTSKCRGLSMSSAMKQENPSGEDVSPSSKHISECSLAMMSAEPKSCDRAGPIETSKLENKNPLMFGAGFKTAGGNVLRVSKKCMSKAKALFADLEEDLVTSEKLPDKQSSQSDAKTQHKRSVDNHAGNLLHHKEDKWNFTDYDNTEGMIMGSFSNKDESVCSVRQVTGIRDEDKKCFKNVKMDPTTCQSEFQMANGKGICISTKAMQEADAFFKDCDVIDSNAGMSGKHKKSIEPLPGSVSHKKNLMKFKNVQGTKVNFSEEPVNEPDVEVHNHGFKNAPTLMTAASFHGNPSSTAKAFSSPSFTTSKNIGSSINELSKSGGFSTASGKKVSISTDALKHAEGLLNEIHTLEDTNKQIKKKGGSLKTGHLTNQIWVSPHKNSGFQTASGKGVTISSETLKKATLLLSECDEVEDVTDELSNGGGFCTASGNKVSMSDDVVTKAKSLLNENATFEDTNKQLKQKEDCLPPQNFGFHTASGKGVAISSAALKKAKTLLSECEGADEDGIGVRPTLSKIPIHGPPPRNSGFLAASGRPVAFSSEALQKAKALFSDISFSAESSPVSDTRNSDKKQDNAENTERMHCGFSTAGGIKDHGSISAKAMQETDASFRDCYIMDGNDGMSVKHKETIAPVSETGSEKKNFSKFKPHQKVTNMSEEPRSGLTAFENVNMGTVLTHENMPPLNVEINKDVFKNTPDSTETVSLHGDPSLMAKPHSSLLCTTSKNIDASAISELNSGGGFCTASGKKVSVSDGAMTKAKSLLNESATFEDTNKQLKQKVDTLPPQNFGFHTASGKGVAISSAALKKAKTLLSECEGAAEDDIDVRPTHSKIPIHGPPPRNSGFLAASGRPVALSSEALQKAKALFSDISFSAESSPVSDTKNSDKKQDNADDTERMHCGFSTTGGIKVHVSQKNLLKANHILREVDDGSISGKEMQETDASFRDCYIMDGNEGMSVKHKESIAPVSGTGSEKKNFSKFKPHQKVTKILEEPRSRHTASENVNMGTVLTHENMPPLNVEITKDVFKNTLDSTETVSLHGDPSLMAKPLYSQLCTTSKNVGASAISGFNNGGGFCTASGKKVSVSDDAMTKAKSLLNESATFEDTNKQLKQKEDTMPPQNFGFHTASGKGVAISSAALKKAKTLLSECEGAAEDDIGVRPTHSKIPIHVPPNGNGGFLAASGRPVAFSSEALLKAKALFSDISFSAESSPVSDTVHSDARNNPGKIHGGFRTAGGAKVHVSQKNLLKAKNLLNVFADGECHDSSLYSSPHDTDKSDISKEKRSSNYNLTSVSDKDMSTNESAPQIVKSLTSLQKTDYKNASKFKELKITPLKVGKPHTSPEEEPSGVLDYEINWTSSSDGSKVKRTERSSVLNLQSLNLRGCSETQQRFLAQEALDCTMALLEDESLAGQILSMTSDNLPLQDNPISGNQPVEEQKRRVKRLLEESNMTGQPPLKRRLLEEFDRTVDGPRGSTLHPEKSSPNGVMKDRRVFKYSVPLHPNITRPHWSGKNYVETTLQKTAPKQHLTPGDCRSAHSKKPAFVPPLFKIAKTESCKNTVLKDNIRTPSAFVPPFKKQRTIVQESSSTPQEEEGKHHHLLVTPSNSNTYVPPSKKTQSTADVTGQKSEDIQSVALADTTNDNPMHLQKVPVGCGSDSSATEASHVDGTLTRSQDMFQNLHNIGLARDMQDMRIRKKKRQTIRPIPGSLFLTKTSGVSRISLKAAVNGKPPARYTPKQLYQHGVHQHVCEITSGTAESLRFNLQQFIKQEAFLDGGGVQLADGGWLIPSNDGTAGKEEFYRALCDTPGVDPKLISEEWVYNHYRWIVWKQASMERSFPETMGSLCLTPEQVLLQLKYRYDIEVDNSRRPALRKIMEKDDTAAKTLVLCVCGVVSRGHSPKSQSFSDTKTPQGVDAKVENPSAVVWLTDGWYAIKALLDEPLTAMLHKGRLAVGGKLIIHGAQLVGSQDACSPLEAPDSLMLKICANSSRPARWDAKLGFHRDPRPYLLPVSCLYSNGGPIGCVDIIILRSYPIQWMERKLDGGVVFRSVRAEEKEARRYNSHKQKAMEILFAKIQAEFEKEEKGNNKPQRRKTVSRQDIASLQDGEELYEAVGDDPAYLEIHLSEQQLETLHNYRRSLMEKKQAELQGRYQRAVENAENGEGGCPKRDVAPVWRLCFADSMDQPGSVYQLNLWRPSSDLQSLLKEGCRYKVYNLTTSDGKKHGGSSTVQLTGTNKTQFQDLQASPEWLLTRFEPRVSSSFVDLQNQKFQPLCGEVDLTGCVISIIDGQGSSPAFYLTDGKLNFVKVRCFSSLSQSGLEDLVKPYVLLALSNLKLRGQSTSPTPVVYAGDLTVFSTNPKEVHLQESLHQLRNLVQGQENFLLTAEEKLSHLVKCDGLSSISSPALQTRTPVSTADRRRDTRTSVSFQQSVRSLGSFTPVSRNPPAVNCSAEKDPSSLKRRRALDYLSRIPSPPPLSHLGSVASPCVNKTFNPPRRSGTPSTLKTVQTPARKPVDLPMEDEWVNDEELAMIDTQALLDGELL